MIPKIKVLGNYIVVNNPLYVAKKTPSGILIPETARKDKSPEEVKQDYDKLAKLQVVQAGSECKNVKTGDHVHINMNSIINPGKSTIEFEEHGYFIFREIDVIFIYE